MRIVAVFSVRVMMVVIFAVVTSVRRMVVSMVARVVTVVVAGVREVAVIIGRVVSIARHADRQEGAEDGEKTEHFLWPGVRPTDRSTAAPSACFSFSGAAL